MPKDPEPHDVEPVVQSAPEPIPYREAMPKEISEAISKVMKGATYVQKKGFNKEHNYKFTAVGDLLAELQPAMAEAGLVVIQDEGQSRAFLDSGNRVMAIAYNFTLHIGGVSWPKYTPMVKTGVSLFQFRSGGIDDKCINKCATAARKYFLLELFQIPSGELSEPDSDGDDRGDHGHGSQRDSTEQFDPTQDQSRSPPPPDHRAPQRQLTATELRQSAEDWHRNALLEIEDCKTPEDLFEWEQRNTNTTTRLSKHVDLHKSLMKKLQDRSVALG